MWLQRSWYDKNHYTTLSAFARMNPGPPRYKLPAFIANSNIPHANPLVSVPEKIIRMKRYIDLVNRRKYDASVKALLGEIC